VAKAVIPSSRLVFAIVGDMAKVRADVDKLQLGLRRSTTCTACHDQVGAGEARALVLPFGREPATPARGVQVLAVLGALLFVIASAFIVDRGYGSSSALLCLRPLRRMRQRPPT
jgi:hypothetical protein